MAQGIPGRSRPGGARPADDKRAPRAAPDVAARAKAEQLHQAGMPFQMAMAVAQGRLDLNEALERMSRKDRVNKLMERHDLSRALATQVAIGHADLELVLSRRRLEEHRSKFRDRTILVPGTPGITLVCHGGRVAMGAIVAVEPYLVLFQEEGSAEPEAIHKLQVRYAYPTAEWKKVKKAVRVDKQAAADTTGPVIRPQDRYTCSDRRLFGYLDAKVTVEVTLLEGDSFHGEVTWFSRYEFGLKIKGDAEIAVFRHALVHIGSAV
jgi:sRNA-binding regulator protein Hfq